TNTSESEMFNCSGTNPFQGLPSLLKFWEYPGNTSRNWWKTRDGLFWICGRRAYSILPANWKGSCTLGIIHPGFFLLPSKEGDGLGIPI
ncbi:ENR1 protein, partial [Steatornis caripensis]|nr:ENR1 protein [Steatornis caripensis]